MEVRIAPGRLLSTVVEDTTTNYPSSYHLPHLLQITTAAHLMEMRPRIDALSRRYSVSGSRGSS